MELLHLYGSVGFWRKENSGMSFRGTNVANIKSDSQTKNQPYPREKTMLPINAILWPTDGSKSALHALAVAVELAETFKSRLYVLEIVNQIPPISEAGYPSATLYTGFDVSKYEQELLKTTRDRLGAIVAENVPETVETEIHVEIGWPADKIVTFARKNNIGLVVMSTRGRSGMAHLMLGSVTERTIQESSVPVLAVPGGLDE